MPDDTLTPIPPGAVRTETGWEWGINAARHSPNCLVSLKTWAATDPLKHCDCELGWLYAELGALRLETSDTARRQWALANVKERQETARWCTEHGRFEEDCVQCAYELGRRAGHIEAGAYYTSEEVFGDLRA